jgi:hypothetical protein
MIAVEWIGMGLGILAGIGVLAVLGLVAWWFEGRKK